MQQSTAISSPPIANEIIDIKCDVSTSNAVITRSELPPKIPTSPPQPIIPPLPAQDTNIIITPITQSNKFLQKEISSW